jgi:hypothetical protein
MSSPFSGEVKPRCVLIASFSDPHRVLEEVERLKKIYELDVLLPSEQWLERMTRLMGQGGTSGKYDDEMKLRFKRIHIEVYLRAIREADFIHVFNIKKIIENHNIDGVVVVEPVEKEYYGMNTLIEIGYAHAHGKLLTSYLKPSEPELQKMISMQI